MVLLFCLCQSFFQIWKTEKMKDSNWIFHRETLPLSFLVNLSGLPIPLLSTRATFLPSSFFIDHH